MPVRNLEKFVLDEKGEGGMPACLLFRPVLPATNPHHLLPTTPLPVYVCLKDITHHYYYYSSHVKDENTTTTSPANREGTTCLPEQGQVGQGPPPVGLIGSVN